VRQGDWYDGTVQAVTALAPDTFPDSKWDCLEVAWDDENGEAKGEVSRVCPWESREFIHAAAAPDDTSPYAVDKEGTLEYI
jgi:hypothetical protein